MKLKKRIAKLEESTGSGRTVVLGVGYRNPGETEEEAWERHLQAHPEDRGAKRLVIHFVGWRAENEPD